MKVRVTKKQIKQGYKNVIEISGHGIDKLLAYESPRYYTTRVEGWGADIYEIDNFTCIVTGYAPFGNVQSRWQTEKKYDDKARKILANGSDYETQKSKLHKLLLKFVDETLGGCEL